jgi:hypothetical protein
MMLNAKPDFFNTLICWATCHGEKSVPHAGISGRSTSEEECFSSLSGESARSGGEVRVGAAPLRLHLCRKALGLIHQLPLCRSYE